MTMGMNRKENFAFPNLQLHSKPCINHAMDLVRTISSEVDLAVFQRRAELEDKEKKEKKCQSLQRNWKKTWILEHRDGQHDQSSEQICLWRDEKWYKNKVKNTIQSARQAVAALAK